MIETPRQYAIAKEQVNQMLSNKGSLSENEMHQVRELSADLYLYDWSQANAGADGGPVQPEEP